MAKLMYRKDSGEILGVHMMGLHSADNIHEFSNAMNMGMTLKDLKFNVHAHPTVAEVRARPPARGLGGWGVGGGVPRAGVGVGAVQGGSASAS